MTKKQIYLFLTFTILVAIIVFTLRSDDSKEFENTPTYHKIEIVEKNGKCVNSICNELIQIAKESPPSLRRRISQALVDAGESAIIPILNYVENSIVDDVSFTTVWLDPIIREIGPAGIPISLEFLKTSKNPVTTEFVAYNIANMNGAGNKVLLSLLDKSDSKNTLVVLKSLTNIENLDEKHWQKIFYFCLNSGNEEISSAAAELIFKFYKDEKKLANLINDNFKKWIYMQEKILYSIGLRDHITSNLKEILIEIIHDNNTDDQVRSQALYTLNKQEANKKQVNIIIDNILNQENHQDLKETACNILKLNGENDNVTCNNSYYK